MIEVLPITITINNELVSKFSKIKSISSKLEAQFNFHTLTANWYGDEENILLIKLVLETPASFKVQQTELAQTSTDDIEISHFSDDVLCCFNEIEQQLLCNIAITESEIILLEHQPKLLAGFLHAKLHKVLNLIAKKHSFLGI